MSDEPASDKEVDEALAELGMEAAKQALREHKPVDTSLYYMRTCPKFDVPEGPHDWLSRHVFVGIGDKTPGGNAIHYYQVL